MTVQKYSYLFEYLKGLSNNFHIDYYNVQIVHETIFDFI